MRKIVSLVMLLVLSVMVMVPVLGATPQTEIPWKHGKLKVSRNQRYLCHADGRPFFWLADTGWRLFARLNKEEADIYLEDRRSKGFNVIQVMGMSGFPQRNIYGETACSDFSVFGSATQNDTALSKPGQYGYWEHVDYIVDRAAEKGIYIAIVPIWGKLAQKDVLTEQTAAEYGRWLALRYRKKPNIIWLNGGDIAGDDHQQIWQALGTSIKKYDPDHLMTFHPYGRTQSSWWFHHEPWLDFNMFQSGHRRYDQRMFGSDGSPNSEWRGEDNWKYVGEDYAKLPRKPVLDGEPSYEGVPQGLHDPTQPYWTADDVRRYAYWSVFAGSCGHTYGHSAVMQMHKPQSKGSYGVKEFWNEALAAPGAGQMQYLKKLLLTFPYFERVPDQTAINGPVGDGYRRLVATRGQKYLLVYTYTGRMIPVHMGIISGRKVNAWWFNPKDGTHQLIGEFDNQGIREFTPPGTEKDGNDWVLVLADSATNYWGRI